MDGIITDLKDLGNRELSILIDLLKAYRDSYLPDDFYEEGTVPAFNPYTGDVFLTNSEYQVCMEVDGKLEMWYSTPYSGHEGFYEDLLEEMDSNLDAWEDEDIQYMKEIAEMRSDDYGIDLCDTMLDLKSQD